MLQKRCKVTAFFFTAKLFNLFFNKKNFQTSASSAAATAPASPSGTSQAAPSHNIYKGRNTANIENGSAVGVMKPAATSNATMAWRR